jgi:hypothetical protein
MANDLSRRLKSASQQLRAARLDGGYADVITWLDECNGLLDEWLTAKTLQPKGDV